MRFSSMLLARILTVAVGPTAALGAGALASCGSSVDEDPAAAQPFLDCIDWPKDPLAACVDGGSGGDGGQGEGGAGPCPVDPAPYMEHCAQGNNGITFAQAKDGQCCYEVAPGAGRPLVIEGRARTAKPLVRDGWRAEIRVPAAERLGADARARVAEAWTAEALLEHASVASFSLLALDLVALGAPADLVAAAHRAALDEVRHARICFALASAYADTSVGPAPLAQLRGSGLHPGLRELVAETVVAGCVGETLAACALKTRAALAEQPIERLLQEVADDEAEHAVLAWRIVAWAIQVGGDEIRTVATDALKTAVCEAQGRGWADGPALPDHGHPDGRAIRDAERVALAEVVLPAAQALWRAGPLA